MKIIIKTWEAMLAEYGFETIDGEVIEEIQTEMSFTKEMESLLPHDRIIEVASTDIHDYSTWEIHKYQSFTIDPNMLDTKRMREEVPEYFL